jgi:hypothetical protein
MIACGWFAVVAASWSISSAAQNLPTSQVEIAYLQPTNPFYRPIFERLKRQQVLEELREFLAPLRLSRVVAAKIEQCDKESRPYQPGGSVTICYEYIHELEKLAEKIPAGGKTARGVTRGDAIVGAFVQIVLHEMSHAVFDVFELPVWGREEDAADRLAAFLMLQFGTDMARRLLNGAAFFFEASDRTWTGSDFSEVTATDAQRFYNYLCIAYGGDEQAFADFVQSKQTQGRHDLLPLTRKAGCRSEYFDLRYAFEQTIMPWVDQGLLRKVLAKKDWLRTDDGQ